MITVQHEEEGGEIVTSEYQLRDVLYEATDDGVVLITLNTPETLNALTGNQNLELRCILDHCSRDTSVRVVVITGSGRAFCSGASQKPVTAPDTVPSRTVALLDKRCRESMLGVGVGDSAEERKARLEWRSSTPDRLS